MSIFTGAGVAIVTPMTETGAVNYPKLEETSGVPDCEWYRRHHYLRNDR